MSFGPCMCGDTHCSSCGPAQGNWKCPLCGTWADDGCEHFDDEGSLREEFVEQVRQIEADQRAADDAYARDLIEAEKLAEQYWKDEGR